MPQRCHSRQTPKRFLTTSQSMLRCQLVKGALRHKAVKCLSTSAHRSKQLQSTRFPPPEIAKPPTDPSSSSALTPEIWGHLQLPTQSALHAFANRIGLGAILTSHPRILQICTHPSFVPFHTHYSQYTPTNQSTPLPSNESLETLGNSLLGLFASEHLHASYPHLPNRVIKAAVTAYVGPTTCAAITREFGAASLIRWRRSPAAFGRPAVLLDDALSSISRSIIGVLYLDKSLHAARKFFNDFFISRELDLRTLLRFRDPKLALRETIKFFKRDPPKSR